MMRDAHALPLLLEALQSPDAATRLVAVSAVEGFRGDEALAALEGAGTDPDESVRTAAMGFLAVRPGLPAARALIRLVGVPAARARAAAALSRPVEGRVAAILEALETADDQLAPHLAAALARAHTHDAEDALCRALELDNVAARKAAATALGALGTSRAARALRRPATSDAHSEVRRICSLVLAG